MATEKKFKDYKDKPDCVVKTFHGGHFFIDVSRSLVAAAIAEGLRGWAKPS